MITLDQVKLHCRIDQDEEDPLINDWIADAEQVIQNDLDRRIIADESDREDETDLLDNDWLNSARLIYVQYRYSRSLDGKPQAYWDLLQKFRIMGV
ncbi:head-tail connector protein [uncultured Acinetobacter sp.]|uniref:head-tail connector protein n=1 Tax=uncultured Acinetobacter sp. TaxID=165433 RepID=UPI002586DBC4|nr:head-tail connector protein [uncultured Acinetobacter sp.]